MSSKYSEHYISTGRIKFATTLQQCSKYNSEYSITTSEKNTSSQRAKNRRQKILNFNFDLTPLTN